MPSPFALPPSPPLRVRVGTAAVVLAVAGSITATSFTASSALAAPAVAAPALLADGTALGGSSQSDGSFLASVAAPAGSAVKFKLDGVYLGQDTTAPYSWAVATGAGTHQLNARWETPSGRQESTVRFTVAPSSTSPQTPAPGSITAPAPGPTAGPQPRPSAAPAPGSAVRVSTAAGLRAALATARPGQVIELRDGRYVGDFTAAASGTTTAPITLRGSRGAVLSSGSTSSGYGLHITGSNWRISGFSVASSAKGIVLDGSTNTFIDAVDVGMIGSEAVHFRYGSSGGGIFNSLIHDTGLVKPGFGEGIYIGSAVSNWEGGVPDRSDRVTVRGNRITNTAAEGIDVKEGTTGGVIIGNTFTNAGMSGVNYADSWVDLKGNGYRVEGNSGSGTGLDAFQVHEVAGGWGTGNAFTGNTVLGGVPGYEVWVQSPALGTTVQCKPTGAAKGLSNLPCRP